MSARAVAVLSMAVLAAAPGCRYLAARGKDLSDIIAPGFSPGGGTGARAGLTRFVAVEVMAQKDETFAGWRSRTPRWIESSYGLLFATWRMPGLGTEERPERRWFDVFTTSRRRILHPNREHFEDRRHTMFIYSGGSGQRWIDFLDVEVGASAFVGGVELAVRPGEFLDFLLGFFGLDIGEDDTLTSEEITILPGSRAK